MGVKNQGNRKAEQSKAWMEDALLRLMKTEVYENITIQEIADHAKLTRRTFYRNYASKDEIIEECFLRIWKEYESRIKAEDDLSLPNISKIFFTVMSDHIDFLLLMDRHNLLPLLMAKVDELLPAAFYEIKGDRLPFDKEIVSYALTFSMGGFLRILIQWLREEPRRSPEEMSSIVKDLLLISRYPNFTA